MTATLSAGRRARVPGLVGDILDKTGCRRPGRIEALQRTVAHSKASRSLLHVYGKGLALVFRRHDGNHGDAMPGLALFFLNQIPRVLNVCDLPRRC